MRERPCLMKGPLVRQTLADIKTQTRRIIQSPAKNMQRAGMKVIQHRPPGDPWYRDHVWSMRDSMGVWGDYTHEQFLAFCPYGAPGDRLWVRETHAFCPRSPLAKTWSHTPEEARVIYGADGERRLSGPLGPWKVKWRPSIHMPRWASRLTLEVTEVRVERLQDISEEDARAEGVEPIAILRDYAAGPLPVISYRKGFEVLWEQINGPASWDANPWVWVVGFKRIEAKQEAA